MTLSPDETEVAVVLWSADLLERRLAVFSTATGDLIATLENGDANYFANPVYSTDGTQIAAATATFVADQRDEGEVTIWDHTTIAPVDELWSWPVDDTETLHDHELFWNDCARDMGFSNDGRYVSCQGFTAEIGTDDLISAYAYEPGFNTLPTGFGYANGRPVYGPEFTPPARVRMPHTNAQAQVITINRETTTVVELGREEWDRAAVALDGDSTTALIARTWGGSGADQLVPRFARPTADLTIATIADGAVIDSIDLAFKPSTMRFSPSGDTFGILTEDFELLLFDSP